MLFWWLFVYVSIRICFILWSGPVLTNCDYDFVFGSVWSLGHRWGGLAPMVRQFKEVARFGMLQMSPGGQRTIQPQWGGASRDDTMQRWHQVGTRVPFSQPINLLSLLAPAVPAPRYPTIFSLLPFAYSKIVSIFLHVFLNSFLLDVCGPLILKAFFGSLSSWFESKVGKQGSCAPA